MAKSPFDLSAVERAIGLARNPPFADPRKSSAKAFGFDLERQLRLHFQVMDSPTMKAAREISEGMALMGKRHEDIMAPFSQRIAASSKALEMALGIGQTLGSFGVLERAARQQQQWQEAMRPFGSLLNRLDLQQSAIKAAMEGLDAQRWSAFTDSITQGLNAGVGADTLATASEIGRGIAASLEGFDVQALGEPAAAALLFNVLRSVIGKLADAKKGLDKLTVFDWLAAISFILTLNDAINPPYTEEDRRVTIETLHKAKAAREFLEKIEEQAVLAAEAKAGLEQLIEHLPRAIIVGAGRVRAEPIATSKMKTKLPQETEVAILQISGKWREVMYSDSLSQSRQRGWVYADSLEML